MLASYLVPYRPICHITWFTKAPKEEVMGTKGPSTRILKLRALRLLFWQPNLMFCLLIFLPTSSSRAVLHGEKTWRGWIWHSLYGSGNKRIKVEYCKCFQLILIKMWWGKHQKLALCLKCSSSMLTLWHWKPRFCFGILPLVIIVLHPYDYQMSQALWKPIHSMQLQPAIDSK